ncbi:rhodanese-like domain-containing protein [Neotabrizicola sp. sgz301269]|uniref:rhodanese-like domain-containing protein n=1 Tax=Neotabrizicola sp. sgz301269 TaxID=3276282 RepID=UPI00376F8E18
MFSFLRRGKKAASPSTAELAQAAARGEILLVDVREAQELAQTGKAKGALHLPLGQIAALADPSLPGALIRPGKPVAVYCVMGARSAKAAEVLRRLGYDPVWNLGGLKDWIAGGGQVESA